MFADPNNWSERSGFVRLIKCPSDHKKYRRGGLLYRSLIDFKERAFLEAGFSVVVSFFSVFRRQKHVDKDALARHQTVLCRDNVNTLNTLKAHGRALNPRCISVLLQLSPSHQVRSVAADFLLEPRVKKSIHNFGAAVGPLPGKPKVIVIMYLHRLSGYISSSPSPVISVKLRNAFWVARLVRENLNSPPRLAPSCQGARSTGLP